MELAIYQVDAFTQRLFAGNPAAVVPLAAWLPDTTLQAIAAENNLSETAYVVPDGEAYQLRWFTPDCEVALCGHATLATAWVLYNRLDYTVAPLRFNTLSGELRVNRLDDGRLELDFPCQRLDPCSLSAAHQHQLANALGCQPLHIVNGEDVIVELATEAEVRALSPDFKALAAIPVRGVIVTAAGDSVDFVSRFFGPNVGVDEDPVTGSAHTKLTPYWADKTGRTHFTALQVSARGGELECELVDTRVFLRGHAVPFLTGTIQIPDGHD
ncbi:PhzF family phenazine biosynthesis protein [Simiduia agarivorans]|uniref:PhzF family phenazine biosynthesis protein n=1 Tax=Simiduia agarivorans (strain DSM 21679 / JCM 13881 / BCRC 17597 / SA1) TaxID=1117647 RepID=K4KP21_SIMAS|nr:PhzF family phenazine biosynthesis protein [Simiduia agarivorans]AFU99863.1 PhzF family phenazine biosynthesis protein [Simiduia agarivorans SA1 = DSM 21679]